MSPPNCIAALLHWRTLFNLISLLDEEDQQSIWDITTTCNLLGEPLCHGVVQENADEQSASLDFTSTPKIADVHLHLDLMFQRMPSYILGRHCYSIPSPRRGNSTRSHYSLLCISVYVSSPINLMKLPPLTQNVQIGFHLCSAAKEFPRPFPQFQKLAESPQAAAISEIGLDYTWRVSSYVIQKQHQLFALYPTCDVSKQTDHHSLQGWKESG